MVISKSHKKRGNDMEKKSDIAKLQNQLTGALIGLARAVDGNEHLVTSELDKLVLEGLLATLPNANFQEEALTELIKKVQAAKYEIVPDCAACTNACGRTADYDLGLLWQEQEETRSLKSLILFGIRGAADYIYHAEVQGHRTKEILEFIYKALFALGIEWDIESLLPIVMDVGEITFKCMDVIDEKL